MIRVVLIDDEPLARQGMRRLLSAHRDVEIVAEAERVSSATAAILREKPDAIFLDIQMPGPDGFELLKTLDPTPRVIFCTAHSQHAVRAFEVDAVDYLLKPVRPERLADALARLRIACNPADPVQISAKPSYGKTDRICLRTPQRTVVAALSDIAALEADRDFTRFYIAGESPLLICHSLGEYARTLPSPPFQRLSRSIMVNTTRIARTDHATRNESHLWLKGLPEPLTLGRAAQKRLSGFLRSAC